MAMEAAIAAEVRTKSFQMRRTNISVVRVFLHLQIVIISKWYLRFLFIIFAYAATFVAKFEALTALEERESTWLAFGNTHTHARARNICVQSSKPEIPAPNA